MAKVYRAPAGNNLPLGLKQNTLVAAIVLIVVIVLIAVTGFSTCFDVVKPTQAAVIINNLTGKITARFTPGWIVHLPYGLTDVYLIDKQSITLQMAQDARRGDRQGVDNIRIKSNDGSNVFFDATIQYVIMSDRVNDIVQYLGKGDSYKVDLIRQYSRSIIRDQFGLLSIDEISSPSLRNVKILEATQQLSETMALFGARINFISATNFDFDPKFKEMINTRIEAEQKARNEKSAQLTKQQIQLMEIARSTREQETAIRTTEGEENKRVIETRGQTEKLVIEALGQAAATRTDGDRLFAVAQAGAEAIRTEGLSKAQGIKKLSDAYTVGGISLVREALATKFLGKRINGRPYSLDIQVSRLQLEQQAAAAAKIEKEGDRNND